MTTAPVERTTGWVADDSTFGARLALVRQRMRWGNVAAAAAACGQPVESWRTWERDNVTPRNIVQIARQIADTTGCDYYWLLTGPARTSSEGAIPITGRKSKPSDRPSSVRPTGATRPSSYPPNGRRPRRLSPPLPRTAECETPVKKDMVRYG